jgi:hypothetical protein
MAYSRDSGKNCAIVICRNNYQILSQWKICGGIMFLPYAVEDNIEKKPELNVVLNESLNTINKGNGNKVSSVGIIVFHEEAA